MHFILLLILGGLLVGIIGGLLGIGGGVLLVPLLVYGFKLPIHQAIGTSLVVIIPTAISGSLVHISHSHVVFKYVLYLVVFTILGSFLGAQCAQFLPAPVLKKIFAIFLFVIAFKMLLAQ